MKPASFHYHAPRSLDEALALLAEHGDDAKVLAGGQSLVPAMNFRLARPAVLVDLNGVNELSFVMADDGSATALRIGAMTRQRTVERDLRVARRAPLLHRAMPFIAHPQIRNRGTVGGSLAHADPAAELPAVAVALDARFLLRRRDGQRWVLAREFYTGLFTTALEANEMLVAIEIPAAPARTGWAFQEFSRRHGDFALAGVAAGVTFGEDGRCLGAQVALLGVGEGPILVEQAGFLLAGATTRDGALDAGAVAAAARAAADQLEPPSDIHASSRFRRHLAGVLVERCLHAATADALDAFWRSFPD
jgi:carbon-monoxide dehydrogenase medium subunit